MARDIIANTITVETDSFSPFVLGAPEPASLLLLGAAVPLMLRRQPKSRARLGLP